MMALYVAPTVAKTMTRHIAQLTELDKNGKVEPVKRYRKTEDGRSVIDRGMYPDSSDFLLKGTSSIPINLPACLRCVVSV
jgi:hypothetical protein